MTDTFQMTTAELLPGVDASDACLTRLVATLRCHEGVREVHLEPETQEHPSRLCMHHDPAVIAVSEVAEMARELCGGLREHFGHLAYRVQPARRACLVGERLKRRAGVTSVRVASHGLLHVEFSRAAADERRLRREARQIEQELTEATHEPT